MRRTILHTIAVAVCAAALTACAADPTADTAAPKATSSTASAAATVSKEVVCTELQALSLASKTKILEAMTAALGALSDPTKEPAAIKALNDALAPLGEGLNTQAARTADPELKAAVTAYAAEVAKVKTALESAGTDLDKAMEAADEDAMSAAEEKITNLCA